MMAVPMPGLALGLAAAITASVLFDVAVALQALETRRVTHRHALRPSLLVNLVQRRVWLLATGLALLGWPFQVAALALAPLTVVQPALAAGLLLLLVLGVRILHEHVGKREVGGVLAIVVGVAGITWAAPSHTDKHGSPTVLAIAFGLLAVPMLLPYLPKLRRSGASMLVVLSAGFAYSWTGLSSKLLSDHLLAHAWLAALGWVAVTAVAGLIGLLSEMSSLQRRPATQVAPIVFVIQMVVPVMLAPLLGSESWESTPLGGGAIAIFLLVVAAGTAALASSPAVAGLVGATSEQQPDRDGPELAVAKAQLE